MKKYFLPLIVFITLPLSIKAEEGLNSTFRQPYLLERPCPSDLSRWGCWGYQTMTRLINGASISYCGVENGSLHKDDFWDFAIEYAKNQFPPKSRNQARDDIIQHLYKDRFAILNSAKYGLNKAGGCDYLLEDNYPSLLRTFE